MIAPRRPFFEAPQYLCLHRDAIFRRAHDIYVLARTPIPIYIQTFQIATTSFSELRK